ncbi:MAG TPA: HAD-IA family hydrolase [Anaerolineae bacterium]|nr:HAD-IA family hydrolase [Anaerolineae bacterium]
MAQRTIARSVVFDLWYTLICPEDFRGIGKSSSAQIPMLLRFDAAHFGSYWRSLQPIIYRSTRPLQQHLQEYAAGIGRDLTAEELRAFDLIWSAHDAALSAPRPEVLTGLDDLRAQGFRLGLLSNAHEREMRHWSDSPLATRFDVACFSYEIGSVKPESTAYETVLDRLGAASAEAVFVGDGASQELLGASNAGIAHCIHMQGFLKELNVDASMIQHQAEQASHAVDNIGELAGLLSLG